MSDVLSIGVSGLRAHQVAIATTGHNISNGDNEAYSRQQAIFATNTPQYTDAGYVGTGVRIETVRRIQDEFITRQLRVDTSVFNTQDTFAGKAGELDSLLADPGTGLAPGIDRLFSSIQTAADDPSSLPARQVAIREAEGLVDRFHNLSNRLEDMNEIINGQLSALTEEVTAIAEALAEVNRAITSSPGIENGNTPNELLDQRDQLLKELSELVAVDVVTLQDQSTNVFIGSGKILVLGTDYRELTVTDGTLDPQRNEVRLVNPGVDENVGRFITGGKLGGLLEFRREMLDPSLNQLGRLALAIQDGFNEQQKLGLDLDGNYGKNLFRDINDPELTYSRITPSNKNAPPNDRIINITIEDVAALQDTDYEVIFPGPDDKYFTIRRSDNGEIVAQDVISGYPTTVSLDGFAINFENGSYQAGDRYLVTPTRTAAKDIEMATELPELLAFAGPVSSDAFIGNQGSGQIAVGKIEDINNRIFSTDTSTLSPPLIVRFSSPTTYDILDNSDPSDPVPLQPPIMNQTFVRSVTNEILPQNINRRAFSSYGAIVPLTPSFQASASASITPGNGLHPQRFTISEVDESVGSVNTQPLLDVPGETSAKDMASLLNERPGVSASANSRMQITSFNYDVTGFAPEKFVLNGVELTEVLPPTQNFYDADYPEEVPSPVDPDFLADRINSNFALREAGIVARSDGVALTIEAMFGDDLTLEFTGDVTDSIDVSNGQKTELTPTGGNTFGLLSENKGFDFSQGGPYTYDFSVPGQGDYSIELTGTHATGASLLAEIKSKIEDELVYPNAVTVDIDPLGTISFKPIVTMTGTNNSDSSKVTIGGQVHVELEENMVLTTAPPGSNMFPEEPELEDVYLGFQATIDGLPETGDLFTLEFNQDAVSDNRNAIEMVNLNQEDAIGGNTTFSESYSKLVEDVGTTTNQVRTNADASKILMQNSQANRDAISGVNLDEEAANLIKFELGYNASAQVISVARDIIDTLLNSFR